MTWKKESERHSAARRGVKTTSKLQKTKLQNRIIFDEYHIGENGDVEYATGSIIVGGKTYWFDYCENGDGLQGDYPFDTGGYDGWLVDLIKAGPEKKGTRTFTRKG